MFFKFYLYTFLVCSLAYLIREYGVLKDMQDYVMKYFMWSPGSSTNSTSERLFTVEELAAFTGENEGPIYLSILGNVFDVTKGRKHYGKTGSYSIFAGKDGSKAFITGDFTDAGATDDISGLSLDEVGDLFDWLSVYKKDYLYKGKLIGRFYGSGGEPTPFLKNVEEKHGSIQRQKKEKDRYKIQYPPCNVEWSPENGSRFWCSKQSGGIKRNWVGVPRKFYEPGSSSQRCACVNPSESSREGKVLHYDGCHPSATECTVKT